MVATATEETTYTTESNLKVTLYAQPSQPRPLPAPVMTFRTARPDLPTDKASLLSLIAAHPTLPPHSKRVLSLTLQVPRGRYTTYGLLAAFISSSSKSSSSSTSSSPRAVGSALRRNPFAPNVPCHRVLATGGGLGGFKGRSLVRDGYGITLQEKRWLLQQEGVKFEDSDDGSGAGKVIGKPWNAFV